MCDFPQQTVNVVYQRITPSQPSHPPFSWDFPVHKNHPAGEVPITPWKSLPNSPAMASDVFREAFLQEFDHEARPGRQIPKFLEDVQNWEFP